MNTLRAPWRLGALVFVAGAGTLSTEIAASRLLAPYFGSSTVVWANVIGLILVYLSVGYWFGGRLADRRPNPALLGTIVLAAGAFIAVTPFAARPILDLAVRGFASVSIGSVLGSFLAALGLFAIPVTLLGTVSPFAVRLALTDVEHAGEVAGRLYALSTVGSILGTFASALVTIEAFGTTRTMVGTAVLLAVASTLMLGRKALPAPVVLSALLLLPLGAVKGTSGLLYERESPYQYVAVVRQSGGTRVLELNEGVAYHSMWRRGTVLTGEYWDLFLLLPPLLARPPQSMLVIGNAGGTIARAYGRFYPGVRIDGVEIDPAVTAAGRRYLGLQANPRLRVYTDDGRPFLERSHRKYDLIVVDAYRQPYVPFYLATKEFFSLAREHLRPGGLLAMNVAKVPGDDRLSRAIGTTLLSAFPQAWRWPALRFNDVLFAFERPLSHGVLASRADRVPSPLRSLVPLFRRELTPVQADGSPLTDDHAPVEWLTDRMLVEQIMRGKGLDEASLPTAP
ncbi:MAG: fused MFS/spermidine synthase [Gaiellaceae bacterium]